ncbi:hypothetical protein A9Q98_04210 [Thalassotalea sp. 42_200_T64]|nr:hypothetical protein A9Q98_04210 [Thalassotalea sp. 42_200_T64]
MVGIDDLENLLAEFGAKFVYILNTQTLEARTWGNQGKVEVMRQAVPRGQQVRKVANVEFT